MNRNRWLAFFVFCGMVLMGFGALQVAKAAPQEGENKAADNTEAPQGAAKDSKAPPLNMLQWTYKALGIKYTVIFLGMSFVFVALLITSMGLDQIVNSKLRRTT